MSGPNESSRPRTSRGIADAKSHASATSSLLEYDLAAPNIPGWPARDPNAVASRFRHFAEEAECLPTMECNRLRELARRGKLRLHDAHIVGLGQRAVALVRREPRGRLYWADARTGTLYRTDDGRCLSSTFLRMEVAP